MTLHFCKNALPLLQALRKCVLVAHKFPLSRPQHRSQDIAHTGLSPFLNNSWLGSLAGPGTIRWFAYKLYPSPDNELQDVDQGFLFPDQSLLSLYASGYCQSPFGERQFDSQTQLVSSFFSSDL